MSCDCNEARLSNLGPTLYWDLKQGSDFNFSGVLYYEGDTDTVTDIDGNTVSVGDPVDLTGCTITCQIRKNGLDTGTAEATGTCTIIDATAGEYNIDFTASQIDNLACGENIRDRASQYVADILCEFPSGDVLECANVFIKVRRKVTK